MTKVFISSTWEDLKEHRRAVIESLDRLRIQGEKVEWLGMEAFSAVDKKPADACREYVKKANVYVGIFGMRYGSLDEKSRLSLTEIEYRCAVEHTKPRLLFLMEKKNTGLLPSGLEPTSDGQDQLKTLKEEIARERAVSFFSTPEDLGGKVVAALMPYIRSPIINWQKGFVLALVLGLMLVLVLGWLLAKEPTQSQLTPIPATKTILTETPSAVRIETSSFQIIQPPPAQATLAPPPQFLKIATPVSSDWTVIAVRGTYRLATEDNVWIFLVDIYGGYYLQDPPVKYERGGTWTGPRITAGAAMKYIVAIGASPDGHKILQQWVAAQRFSQISQEEIQALPGYRELDRVERSAP